MDLGTGTTRCNCTFCTKAGWWGCLVKPGAFRLLSGSESLFCKVCGIRSFGHGDIPELGGSYYSVNLNCLDGVDLSTWMGATTPGSGSRSPRMWTPSPGARPP
jgi:hypothetical protein